MPIQLTDGFDFIGQDRPLRFVLGQLVEIQAQIVDDNGAILDISGRTYTADVGIGDGTAAIASFTYTIDDGPNGLVTLSLDSGSVVGLTEGSFWMEVWENTTNFLWGGPVEITAKKVS